MLIQLRKNVALLWILRILAVPSAVRLLQPVRLHPQAAFVLHGKAAPTTTPASYRPTIPAWESDAGFAARKQDSIPIGQ